MSKRYGRNQKRRHREQVKRLEGEVLEKERIAAMYKNKSRESRQEAFNAYLNKSGLLQRAVMEISHQIGKQVGKELEPIALQIFKESYADSQPPVRFYDEPDMERNVRTVSVVMERFEYCVRMMETNR